MGTSADAGAEAGAGGAAGTVTGFAAPVSGASADEGAAGLLSGPSTAAISLGRCGPVVLRVTYTYHATNPTVIANPSNPSRSQNAGVSAGRTGWDERLGRALSACAGACEALAASSAEGPECANPGSRPAQPLQNMALARLELPQASQMSDIGFDALTP